MTVTVEDAVRISRIARVLIACALANRDVRRDMMDLSLRPLVTAAQVRANPPVKVEFEHVSVIAPLGDALAAGRNKPTFGEMIGVLPVDVDDPVHHERVLYVYKASSPYNRRVNQRKWMKKRLGKGARRLVTLAMRSTLRIFLEDMEDPKHGWPEAVRIVKECFKLSPRDFWRAARGKDWLDIPPPPPVQLEFPFEE